MKSELLEKAWAAHGGLDHWNSFDKVHATIVTGGQLFEIEADSAGLETARDDGGHEVRMGVSDVVRDRTLRRDGSQRASSPSGTRGR